MDFNNANSPSQSPPNFHVGPYRIGGRYAKYILFLLILVYAMNLLDRQILAILAGEIQADLGISDSQMGFLYGTSFAVFYAIFGLPLGRLADLWVRKTLIACGLFTWSVMTMLCGMAGGAVSLTFFRFGVGIGEATATPSAYSLLSDWFEPKDRASVIAIYSTGAYIGMGLSMFIGGWIVDWWNLSYPDIADAPLGLKGWQVTFIIVGAPGVLLAALFKTLKEPVRGFSENVASIQNHPHPFKEGWGELASILPPFSVISLYRRVGFTAPLITNILAAVVIIALGSLISHLTDRVTQWVVLGVGVYALFSWAKSLAVRDPVTYAMIFRCKSMVYVNLAYPIITFITYGFALWLAQYLLRKFDADLSELGMALGLSTAICGGVGVATGGVVADLMKRHIREDAHTFMGLISGILTTIAALFVLNAETLQGAYIANAFLQFVSVLWTGAAGGIITTLVLPRMRATASAFYLAMGTFLGLAMGPFTIGYLSDSFQASGNTPSDSLGLSLKLALLVYLIVALFTVLLFRHYRQDFHTREARAIAAGEPAAP
jgi:MFS family permease